MKNLLLFFVLIVFVSCKNNYPVECYGTYENIDSFHVRFTVLNLHKNNNYSFYTGSCMDGTKDTGEFELDDGILSFKSFLPIDTANQKADRRLTKYKFDYKQNKVYFLWSSNPSFGNAHNLQDTVFNLTKRTNR